jgi:hypothetical protein
MRNSEKTISANSKGIIITYGDVNKHMYTSYGNSYVKKVQLEGTSKYQNVQTHSLTPTQKELYFKIVYGFSSFSNEELASMSKTKKYKVLTNYTKAHRILNRWKQEIINESVNNIMSKLFPNSPVVKKMLSVNGYDDTLDCSHMSFKDLGISRKQIIDKLIEFSLLPQNFYQLA